MRIHAFMVRKEDIKMSCLNDAPLGSCRTKVDRAGTFTSGNFNLEPVLIGTAAFGLYFRPYINNTAMSFRLTYIRIIYIQ